MDPVILGILGGECDEPLQMFEKVMVVHTGTECKTCHICIGRLHLYFVSKEMDRLVEGKKLSYLSIEKAITDTSTRRYFLLKLREDRDPAWGSQILIESQFRDLLLERIALCWQTSFMFRRYQVEKFPQAKASLSDQFLGADGSMLNIDQLQVNPFQGYEGDFKHRGYSFFLRTGFKTTSGLKLGTYVHDTGWTVTYNRQSVVVPAATQVTVHVGDLIPSMELERSASGADDIRTIAAGYKQALTEALDQFYVLVNAPYAKKMNRTNDIASWDGWEFFVRSRDHIFVCVLLRRENIPPLCDVVQDVVVLLRAPGHRIKNDACEVLLDECRFVADSLATTSEGKAPYREIIQARLDTLQFNEDAYLWLEGNLKMMPVHRKPAAIKFVRSIVYVLVSEGLIFDDQVLEDDVFRDTPWLHNPLLVPQEMLSDAEPLLGTEAGKEERRNSWYWRISRYLAYCVDGGIMGERFTLADLVRAVGKGGYETDKKLKGVIEFLLHVVPRNDWKVSFGSGRLPLFLILQDPSNFADYMFNERVMRVLISENYIQAEWARKKTLMGSSYENLLATMLVSENVGMGLRTLICRQVLESTNAAAADTKHIYEHHKPKVLVPALVKVMQGGNLSLASCATAALVNLSCGTPDTKTLLVQQGAVKICMEQLKAKDEDLTLYTLYLLVNLTKTPHHRAIVVREGGVPLLVDILTSSYQNLRKQKVLTEVASVLGQLCNDRDTRSSISDDFPVVPCLLWIYDAAEPNTKLKSKLIFALRQLCAAAQNKIKVGHHVIPKVIEELSVARPNFEECATNAILLLTMLASIHSNAQMMNEQGRLDDAITLCGIPESVQPVRGLASKWGPHLTEKVAALKERIKESVIASGG